MGSPSTPQGLTLLPSPQIPLKSSCLPDRLQESRFPPLPGTPHQPLLCCRRRAPCPACSRRGDAVEDRPTTAAGDSVCTSQEGMKHSEDKGENRQRCLPVPEQGRETWWGGGASRWQRRAGCSAGGEGVGWWAGAREGQSQGVSREAGPEGRRECIGGRARSQGLSAQRCLILHLKLFSGLGY